MENLFRKLETPALSEIDVQWEDEAVESYPSRVPDLYSGEPLVMTALLPNGAGGVELAGYRGGSTWETALDVCGGRGGAVATGRSPGNEFPGSVNQSRLKPTEVGDLESPSGDFPNTQPGNSFPGGATCLGLDQSTNFVDDPNIPTASTLGIAKLWARRKIESITDSMIEGVDAQAVRNAVVALGLEHHLVTQYTSLVAVDVTPTSPVAGGETRNVPVNRPHGSTATLPRTATPATLYALIALVLLAAALMLRPKDVIGDHR
jgi:Ca-activated chloride channel family protein